MMKKIRLNSSIRISGLLILTILILTACAAPGESSQPNQPDLAPANTAAAEPPGPTDNTTEDSVFTEETVEIEAPEENETNITSEPADSNENTTILTDAEKASLIFMREEEKLAHDVYLALYDLWGLPVFQNIARSEEAHTSAVKRLLDRFDIPDPADQSPMGIFQDQSLQALYDQLIELGTNSLADALKVGGAIEEIDILDLQEQISATTNLEIQRVYENLLNGSENHLRAFTSTLLQQANETYHPQYMDVDTYNAIVSATAQSQKGNNRRRP
jgi:hypothetical protein